MGIDLTRPTKTVLILWSGGWDSTYLIFEAIKKNYNIILGTIVLKNNPTQIKMEKLARIKIKKYLKNNNLDNNIIYYNFGSIYIDEMNGNQRMLSQPLFWLLFSTFNLDNIDELWMGYIKKDYDNMDYKKIKTLFKINISFINDKVKAKLKFPILKKTRKEIIDKLPKEVLLSHIHCESPVYENKKWLYCNGDSYCLKCEKLKEKIGLRKDFNLNNYFKD